MKRREDGILVDNINGVDCYVSPFNPQDGARYKWECILGRGGYGEPQLRASGGADSEDEAAEKARWFARQLSSIENLPWIPLRQCRPQHGK